jgi:hypothetical protein
VRIPSRMSCCWILFLTLASSAGLAAATIADDKVQKEKSVQSTDKPYKEPQDSDSDESQKFEGTVRNLSVDKTDTVTISLRQGSDRLMVTGEFGCERLFGRFAISGTWIDAPERGPGRCACLRGKLYLGNDGSGFPEDSSVDWLVTLCKNGDTIEGVYAIQSIDSVNGSLPQMGTLKLRRKSGP